MRFLRAAILTALLAIAFALPPSPLPMAHAAGGQVSSLPILGSTSPTIGATSFRSLTTGIAAWDATEADARNVMPGPGPWTLSNWVVTVGTAPGAAKTDAFTIEQNGADTAITVSITGASTVAASDLTHSITVNAGDKLSIKAVVTASATATGTVTHCLQVTAAGANQVPLMWGSSNSHTETGGSTFFQLAQTGGSFAGEANAAMVCPTSGTISKLYLNQEVPPGAGQTVTVTLRKNKVSTALTAQVTGASGAASADANDTADSVSVVAGDLLDWQTVASATAATGRVRMSALFAPTNNGDFWFGGTLIQPQANTQFSSGAAGNSATESLRQMAIQQACTAKSLYLDATQGTPASGQTWAATLRKGAASQTLTATVTGDGVAADAHTNDTTHTVSLASTDLIDVQNVTSSTSGTVTATWGMVINIAQAASGRPSNQLLQGVGSRPHAPFFHVGAN